MIRRNSIIALAMVALAFASMSFAEAGGSRGGGKGRPAAPPAPPATTWTIVNSTSRSWYTYIHSGTGLLAFTIAEGNAEGAKIIAPGGKGVFNVKPIGLDSPGYFMVINATPPLNVNNPGVNFHKYDPGNGLVDFKPAIQAGQNRTDTITQTSGTAMPYLNPTAP